MGSYQAAINQRKYDFEVVPATTAFGLTITLENVTPQDLQLTCIGLSEFMSGLGAIGGRRSRGLGACTLKDVTVFALELEDATINSDERNRRLLNYLLENDDLTKKFPLVLTERDDVKNFLQRHIRAAFSQSAGRDS
jgi:CRISPR/Cas system CSM-associated protein Csm3 (group 7 of RAMP superfamily)